MFYAILRGQQHHDFSAVLSTVIMTNATSAESGGNTLYLL